MKLSRVPFVLVLSLVLVLALTAGADAGADDIDPGQGLQFTLALGESRYFRTPDVTIRFIAVTEDTRCGLCGSPVPGAVAIRVGVSYSDDQDPSVLDMRLVEGRPAPAASLANGYSLTLHSVLPIPTGGTTTGRIRYEATFSLQSFQTDPYETPAPVTNSPADAPDAPATFNLALGETHYSPAGDVTIHFLSVIEDTRCDAAVPCPRIGAVEIALLVWYSDYVGPEEVTMRLEGDAENTSIALGNGFILTLYEVVRLANAETPDPGSSYVATFSLRASAPSPAAEASVDVARSQFAAK